MPDEVVYYLTRYGYTAIFVLVFLQETGMPNPFPNELLLMFSGYLSYKGLLSLPAVILTVVTADFIGTTILYILFLKTGSIIIRKKPVWVPLSEKLIEKLSTKITKGGKLTIFIFRLTPFTRGYTSVIAGLLQVSSKVYIPITIMSALTWASVYVIAGHLIGPSWTRFVDYSGSLNIIIVITLALIISTILIVKFKRHI